MTPSDIRAWRTAMAWTQDDLAEALSADPEQPKVTRVTIGRWERNESTPPPYLRLALERLAGTTAQLDKTEGGKLSSMIGLEPWEKIVAMCRQAEQFVRNDEVDGHRDYIEGVLRLAGAHITQLETLRRTPTEIEGA